jgi:AraC-like DNA-binding protein
VLFAEADRAFVDHHVVPGTGHKSVIITTGEGTLDELCADANPQFDAGVAGASSRLQMLAQKLRRPGDPLAAQELGIEVLNEAFRSSRRRVVADPGCVRRAKVILHECVEGRLTLVEIARELGVSPIHLTQTFKRAEGVPLYRYQTRLRLSRALDRLPGHDNLSDLAFELGYSSHSHFAAAFRGEFGVAPSHFRSDCAAHP